MADQLWRIAPGEAPRQYTADDGWNTVRIQGMASGLRRDRRRLPDVYLTTRARTIQTLLDRPSKPTYRDISIDAESPRPDHRRAAIHCRRPPGTRSSRTSTTMATSTCSSRRGTSATSRITRSRTVRPVPRRSRRTFSQVAEAAGVLNFARGRGPRSSTSTATGCSISSWPMTALRSGSGGTWAQAGPRRRCRWGIGSR